MIDTIKQTNGQLPETRQLAHSVKKDDTGLTMNILFTGYTGYGAALPRVLPTEQRTVYRTKRDGIMLAAPRYESMWAVALGIAIAKQAALGWEIDSDAPRLRKQAQQMLLETGAGRGLFGWIPFLSRQLKSFFATGFQFYEIERATAARGSRIINIHHLNPLRCVLTGNPAAPVEYLGQDGRARPLAWYQVGIITDMLSATEDEVDQNMSATARAWDAITKMAAIENFIYERVSGRRPLKLTFLGGATQRAIKDALQSAQHDADRQAIQSYMGAAIVGIPTDDVPLSLVEVALADLPDITDVERERLRADLVMANALGLDPQELNPALVGKSGLGSSGNQSQVLADKETGRLSAMWRASFIHQMNQLVLDGRTIFTFSERDLRDEQLQADNADKRQGTRKSMIDAGMITAPQATNLAVDSEDLPPEFLIEDDTAGGVLRDDEKQKPGNAANEETADETADDIQEDDTKKETSKTAVWSEPYY